MNIVQGPRAYTLVHKNDEVLCVFLFSLIQPNCTIALSTIWNTQLLHFELPIGVRKNVDAFLIQKEKLVWHFVSFLIANKEGREEIQDENLICSCVSMIFFFKMIKVNDNIGHTFHKLKTSCGGIKINYLHEQSILTCEINFECYK